jgi:LysM repeat protein
MQRMSFLVSTLVVLAASTALLAIALFMGVLSVPGAGQTARPSGSFVASSPTPSGPPSAAPSATPTATPSAGPSAGGTHIVQPGESLSTIGDLYGVPWLQIAQANDIPEPYVIQVGQELIIPVGAPPTNEPGTHIVQPGESITSIAALYDITPTDLADANPDVADWNLIFVGQRLVIPDGTPSSGASPSPSSTT